MVRTIVKTTMRQRDETHIVPADPTRRRFWILAELRVRGITVADLARQLGTSAQAGSNALRSPSQRWEQAFSEALGMPASVLFPDRYTADGTRIHATRSPDREAA